MTTQGDPPRIGLLGATGYTGRLTAAEFARRGLVVRLGARDASRLAGVAAADGAERVVVDTSDSVALQRFLDGLDVLVTTVGPFTRLGRPVVDAAVAAGVHYVDSTGEPGFMQDVYDAHATAAVAVVPAAAFDYVPGDLCAALAVRRLGEPATRIAVGYDMAEWAASRGTARSALEAYLAMPDARVRRSQVAGRPALALPWGESITVPRWAPGATVEVAMTMPRLLVAGAPMAGPTQSLVRAAAPLLHKLIDRLPDGPDDAARAKARIGITATATSASGRTASAGVVVRDVYGFTAVALVEAALRVGVTGTGPGGSSPVGALTPAQAFDPDAFLAAVGLEVTGG